MCNNINNSEVAHSERDEDLEKRLSEVTKLINKAEKVENRKEKQELSTLINSYFIMLVGGDYGKRITENLNETYSEINKILRKNNLL